MVCSKLIFRNDRYHLATRYQVHSTEYKHATNIHPEVPALLIINIAATALMSPILRSHIIVKVVGQEGEEKL